MFIYNPNIINELEGTISLDRLSTYLNAANGNKETALKLYLWNSEISAAFYLPLQGLEVALRNALHSVLASKYGNAHWYDRAPIDAYAQETVRKAKAEVQKSHGVVNAPHVVAELSFGFWLSLLGKQYHQTLWIPALGKVFSNAHKSRTEVNDALQPLRLLRNRIAHHEPIFSRHLAADYTNVIKTIDWVNKDKAGWIDYHNVVTDTLSRKPALP